MRLNAREILIQGQGMISGLGPVRDSWKGAGAAPLDSGAQVPAEALTTTRSGDIRNAPGVRTRGCESSGGQLDSRLSGRGPLLGMAQSGEEPAAWWAREPQPIHQCLRKLLQVEGATRA